MLCGSVGFECRLTLPCFGELCGAIVSLLHLYPQFQDVLCSNVGSYVDLMQASVAVLWRASRRDCIALSSRRLAVVHQTKWVWRLDGTALMSRQQKIPRCPIAERFFDYDQVRAGRMLAKLTLQPYRW